MKERFFEVDIVTDECVQDVPALQEAIADAIHKHAQELGLTSEDDPATAVAIHVTYKNTTVTRQI